MKTVDATIKLTVKTKDGKSSSIELEYNDMYVNDNILRFPRLKVELNGLEWTDK